MTELTASVKETILTAARKLTGFRRRQFQAEMTHKYCAGSSRRTGLWLGTTGGDDRSPGTPHRDPLPGKLFGPRTEQDRGTEPGTGRADSRAGRTREPSGT